jgi:hypothetical protein
MTFWRTQSFTTGTNFSRHCARAASSLFAAYAAPGPEEIANKTVEMKDAYRAMRFRLMASP